MWEVSAGEGDLLEAVVVRVTQIEGDCRVEGQTEFETTFLSFVRREQYDVPVEI